MLGLLAQYLLFPNRLWEISDNYEEALSRHLKFFAEPPLFFKSWSNKKRLTWLNALNSQLIWLHSQFAAFRGVLFRHPLDFFMDRGHMGPWGKAVTNGLCHGSLSGGDAEIKLNSLLNPSAFAIERDIVSVRRRRHIRPTVSQNFVNAVFRHELGHLVHFDHWLAGNGHWDSSGRKWLDVYSRLDRRLLARVVSHYAVNIYRGATECFAEMFVIVTSPLFSPGSLDRILGVPVEAIIHEIMSLRELEEKP